MSIINSFINWFNSSRRDEIDFFCKNPIDIQFDTFKKLISAGRETEWGKKYNYSNITTFEQYKKNVPIQDYNSIKPYIERLINGENNLLWNEPIKWYAKSSGTTSDKSKYIPVSQSSLENCHFKGGKDVLALYTFLYPKTKLFRGKGLTLGGSHSLNTLNSNSYVGDLSAILIDNIPFWADIIREPKTSIALLSEWEEKLEKITKSTINKNITNISGVPSWYLVLIKHILEYTGKSNLLEIWPNLELFIHGGINFTPYREQYNQLIPSEQMNYMETYNASEGFFGLQNDPTSDSMLLMLDYGVYYEFIPMDQFDKENPDTLNIDEVEVGKNYAMLISTNAGLWRYQIGDTIMFTSKFPHKFKITGRTKHFINAFGEEVIIDNAENALKRACKKTEAVVKEYTAGPRYITSECQGCHEWIIEFEKYPNNLSEFKEVLDTTLMEINSDYEAKRYKDITLTEPVINIANDNLFYNWLKCKGKLGGQNKIPRLSNNREYLDSLLELNVN